MEFYLQFSPVDFCNRMEKGSVTLSDFSPQVCFILEGRVFLTLFLFFFLKEGESGRF